MERKLPAVSGEGKERVHYLQAERADGWMKGFRRVPACGTAASGVASPPISPRPQILQVPPLPPTWRRQSPSLNLNPAARPRLRLLPVPPLPAHLVFAGSAPSPPSTYLAAPRHCWWASTATLLRTVRRLASTCWEAVVGAGKKRSDPERVRAVRAGDTHLGKGRHNHVFSMSVRRWAIRKSSLPSSSFYPHHTLS
ncbi:hypothetical protein P7K49_033632 [Saguinus oedipus]|uniref:Uncharacterized protein n=1 Tax=Saguinus oedipus TaxID=9490 RepID=A0ABQ9TSF9_SAGOE|nr:hypothetical protein P7K49_033632 [Saguinus oedipus]